MTEIDLSDQGLTEIPADVLDDGEEVEELNLANNRIQEVNGLILTSLSTSGSADH